MSTLVLASGNRGKQRELAALLQPLGMRVVLQSELGIETPPETGDTFMANALLKARHASARSNLPAIADDSGLEVDALGGRPGIHSARYAALAATPGEPAPQGNSDDHANLLLLLRELEGVPDEARTARYQCALAWVRFADDPAPVTAQAHWEGRIACAPLGSGGFGYDPVFVPAGGTLTVAQLAPEEKARSSHRALALRALMQQLP